MAAILPAKYKITLIELALDDCGDPYERRFPVVGWKQTGEDQVIPVVHGPRIEADSKAIVLKTHREGFQVIAPAEAVRYYPRRSRWWSIKQDLADALRAQES